MEVTRQSASYTAQVSLPCPVDILALPASLFLGTGLPAPSSLASPHSDSKTPLCLPRRGGLSQILGVDEAPSPELWQHARSQARAHKNLDNL